MNEEPTIKIGSVEIPPGSYLGLKDDFSKLEKSQEKANTFMMWMAGIIVGVFFATGTLIALDYFKYNGERYEKFMDKTVETQKDFYSKDDLKTLLDENTRNSQILDCLKVKGYFSIQCF